MDVCPLDEQRTEFNDRSRTLSLPSRSHNNLDWRPEQGNEDRWRRNLYPLWVHTSHGAGPRHPSQRVPC